MSKTSKSTTKDGLPVQARRYNSAVVNAIAAKRGTDPDYVRKCLRGERHSATADAIVKEYEDLSANLSNILLG